MGCWCIVYNALIPYWDHNIINSYNFLLQVLFVCECNVSTSAATGASGARVAVVRKHQHPRHWLFYMILHLHCISNQNQIKLHKNKLFNTLKISYYSTVLYKVVCVCWRVVALVLVCGAGSAVSVCVCGTTEASAANCSCFLRLCQFSSVSVREWRAKENATTL